MKTHFSSLLNDITQQAGSALSLGFYSQILYNYVTPFPPVLSCCIHPSYLENMPNKEDAVQGRTENVYNQECQGLLLGW